MTHFIPLHYNSWGTSFRTCCTIKRNYEGGRGDAKLWFLPLLINIQQRREPSQGSSIWLIYRTGTIPNFPPTSNLQHFFITFLLTDLEACERRPRSSHLIPTFRYCPFLGPRVHQTCLRLSCGRPEGHASLCEAHVEVGGRGKQVGDREALWARAEDTSFLGADKQGY